MVRRLQPQALLVARERNAAEREGVHSGHDVGQPDVLCSPCKDQHVR